MPSQPMLDELALPAGGFAVLAIDQRDTLRHLLRAAGLGDTEQDVVDFKREVITAVAPHVSGILVDRSYGPRAMREADVGERHPGLILAADVLRQDHQAAVLSTSIDEVTFGMLATLDVRALKLLVLWHADGRDTSSTRSLVKTFVDRCRSAAKLSVVEGVVVSAPDHDLALVQAASELTSLAPDLYKTEVPTHGRGTQAVIERLSRRITEVSASPWVVLSSRVEQDRFPAALAAACDGGASGFMAGRFLWGDALHRSPDALTSVAGRASELAAIVNRHARPWREAGAEVA